MKIELRDHIAQARHPITREPLYHEGKPVPLFPDQHSIWLDGAMVGYVCGPPNYNIAFIVPESQIPEFVRKLIVEQVRITVGVEKPNVMSVQEPRQPEPEDDD